MTSTRILIVDDSDVVRAVLRGHLTEQGHSVVEAADGSTAIRLAASEAPDVVLLDVEMPDLDGFGVLRALKADARLADIPVVFLTGRSGTEDVVEGLRCGAHDYLRKPFEVAELVARVSAALRVKRLQDQLRERNEQLDALSRTDPLTGLPNRRHVQEHLHALAAGSQRNNKSYAVLMVDIDHFKAVNDTHGHAAGDTVLARIASVLKQEVRASDVVGRWGGEEFVIAMPDATIVEAIVIGERLRSDIAATGVPVGSSTINVTVSVGAAATDVDGDEVTLSRADAALYRAKAGGRNRVVIAD